jgi:hypothetical protein
MFQELAKGIIFGFGTPEDARKRRIESLKKAFAWAKVMNPDDPEDVSTLERLTEGGGMPIPKKAATVPQLADTSMPGGHSYGGYPIAGPQAEGPGGQPAAAKMPDVGRMTEMLYQRFMQENPAQYGPKEISNVDIGGGPGTVVYDQMNPTRSKVFGTYQKPQAVETVDKQGRPSTVFTVPKENQMFMKFITPRTPKTVDLGDVQAVLDEQGNITKRYKKGQPPTKPEKPEKTTSQALARISQINKLLATVDKTDTISQLMALSYPALAGAVGQKMDPQLKQDLVDQLQTEREYLQQFVPEKARKAQPPRLNLGAEGRRADRMQGPTEGLPQGLTEEDIQFNMTKYGKTRDEVIAKYKQVKGLK